MKEKNCSLDIRIFPFLVLVFWGSTLWRHKKFIIGKGWNKDGKRGNQFKKIERVFVYYV